MKGKNFRIKLKFLLTIFNRMVILLKINSYNLKTKIKNYKTIQ